MAGAPGVGVVDEGLGFVVADEEPEVAAAAGNHAALLGKEAAIDAPDDGNALVEVFPDILEPLALLLRRRGVAGVAEELTMRPWPESVLTVWLTPFRSNVAPA